MTMNGAAAAAVPEIAAWSADVFVGRDRPAARPVLGPLLARGAITLVTGPRGVGKSWLALALAHAAARGGTLAGWRAREAQRAVYVDAAAGEALLQTRLAALAPATQPPGLVLVPGDAQARGLPDIASEDGREARGKAMPPHLREREELPELEEERRQEVQQQRAEARRKAERRARLAELAALEQERHTLLPNGEKEGPAAQQREDEGEIMAGDVSAKRAIARPLTLTLSPLGRGDAHGVTAHSPEAVKQPVAALPAAAEPADSPEAVKQPPPASLDDVATDEMLAVFLARRRGWRRNLPPPPDRLAAFAYEDLAYVLRSRLTQRVLNKHIIEDDTRGAKPPSRAERLWRTPQHLLPYGGGAP